MNFFCKLLLWSCLYLLVLSGAKAQEPEPWRGIFCTTQASIEQVVKKGTELGGAAEGIQAVNLETENACHYGVAIGIKAAAVNTIQSPDGMLDVVPMQIVAVLTPLGLVKLDEPLTWFTLAESTARGA